MIVSLLVFLLLIMLVLLWFRFARAKELALRLVKQTCQKQQFDLLDDTITLRRVRLARDNDGRVCFKRVYRYRCYSKVEDKVYVQLFTLLGLEPEVEAEHGVIVRLSDFKEE